MKTHTVSFTPILLLNIITRGGNLTQAEFLMVTGM